MRRYRSLRAVRLPIPADYKLVRDVCAGMAQAQMRQNVLWTVHSKIGGVTSTVVFLGTLLILFGVAPQTGVWAGMLGIIDGLLVFVAVVFRVLL